MEALYKKITDSYITDLLYQVKFRLTHQIKLDRRLGFYTMILDHLLKFQTIATGKDILTTILLTVSVDYIERFTHKDLQLYKLDALYLLHDLEKQLFGSNEIFINILNDRDQLLDFQETAFVVDTLTKLDFDLSMGKRIYVQGQPYLICGTFGANTDRWLVHEAENQNPVLLNDLLPLDPFKDFISSKTAYIFDR